jgi:hypothetical protein
MSTADGVDTGGGVKTVRDMFPEPLGHRTGGLCCLRHFPEDFIRVSASDNAPATIALSRGYGE